MSVQPVSDVGFGGNGEEYYFECDAFEGRYSGGWYSVNNLPPVPLTVPPTPPVGPNEYWVKVGAEGQNLTYRVRTRDQSPNQNVSTDSVDATVP